MRGTYAIKNKINNKMYIGKSINIERRVKEHISMLLKNCHENDHLQKSFNKYGKENFENIILVESEFFKDEEIIQMEIKYIKKHKSFDKKFGYNKTSGGEGGCLGYLHTEITRKRISTNNAQNKKNKVRRNCIQ